MSQEAETRKVLIISEGEASALSAMRTAGNKSELVRLYEHFTSHKRFQSEGSQRLAETIMSAASKKPTYVTHFRHHSKTGSVRHIFYRRHANSRFSKPIRIAGIKLALLEELFPDGAEIKPDSLFEVGLLESRTQPIKILGGGTLTKKFNVWANLFAKSASDKIAAAGGAIHVISPRTEAE